MKEIRCEECEKREECRFAEMPEITGCFTFDEGDFEEVEEL